MTRKSIPASYEEARETLKGRDSRTIANNTTLADLGDCIGLRLHSTYVVRFFQDGRISLHTGGWHTVTTKDRLNRVARAHGWSVYAKDRVWYIRRQRGAEYEFEDGFIIPARPKTYGFPCGNDEWFERERETGRQAGGAA